MSNYTPEQVKLDASIIAEAAEVLQMVADSGVTLPPNWRWPLLDELSGIAAQMQDAATLRQQAFSQFANPEALADWLDALHECHADGSVGNRKWEAAQVAARAIRSLNEPSGNSGQLRQQAGRVDEDELRYAADEALALLKTLDPLHGVTQQLEAALAQNTQVDGGPIKYERRMRPTWRPEDEGWSPWEQVSEGMYLDCLANPIVHEWQHEVRALYLHAERARVPEGWSAWHDDESRTWAVRSPAGDVCEVHDRAGDVHAEVLRQLAQDIAAAARARR